MKTLFGDIEDSRKTSVQISLKGKENQTKNQTAFNKLIARVQKLESSIASESIKIDRIFQFYQKTIVPRQIELANVKVEYAFMFDDLTNKARLSKKYTEKVKEAIVQLFEEAFEFVEPTPEQEELFDKWADVSYKDDLDIQKEFGKNMFSSFMENMFGNSIDMDDLDMDDPESVAQFEAKVKGLLDDKEEGNSKSKKKSKKQIEKEEQLKADEFVKNKSLRSIYISLTKILHPDTETDEVLKKEKEEIMKNVVSAYEQKDLSALLKLEMEWVFKTSEHLEKLADDKLKIYISVLKERVTELEQEKFMIYRHPRLEEVSPYLEYPEKRGIQILKEEEFLIRNVIEDFRGDLSTVNRLKSKNDINEFIDEFYEMYCDSMDPFDDEFYW